MSKESITQVTIEDLYKAACWKHSAAQSPWVHESVMYWQAAAHALAWALRLKGLNDRQINQMEEDAIALGPSGRWDNIIEPLGIPDGTAPHLD